MLVPISVPGGFKLLQVVENVLEEVFQEFIMFISRGLGVDRFSVSREIR